MKKRSLSRRRRRPAAKRRRAAPFRAPEPEIVVGKFKGQKLSELSDDEITYFLRCDAQSQTKPCIPSIFVPGQPICSDLSQYWFAKYELERRIKRDARETASSFTLAAEDNDEDVAARLIRYGYRLVARQFHPDAGGDTRSMQQLSAARDYALKRLK